MDHEILGEARKSRPADWAATFLLSKEISSHFTVMVIFSETIGGSWGIWFWSLETQEYIETLNTGKFAGYADWRLKTRDADPSTARFLTERAKEIRLLGLQRALDHATLGRHRKRS